MSDDEFKRMLQNALKAPERSVQWAELLRGELEHTEACTLLSLNGDGVFWMAFMTTRAAGSGHARVSVVGVSDRKEFEKWLREERPGLVEEYEAAVVLEELERSTSTVTIAMDWGKLSSSVSQSMTWPKKKP